MAGVKGGRGWWLQYLGRVCSKLHHSGELDPCSDASCVDHQHGSAGA